MHAESRYVREQLLRHVRLFFKPDALSALTAATLEFCSLDEALHTRRPAIVIPVDVALPAGLEMGGVVEWGGTSIRTVNPLPAPSDDEWTGWPSAENPLWYRHRSGTLLPAWNMFATLFDLLAFGEETRCRRRDRHERFLAAFSDRARAGLLEEPFFNNAAALLVAAALGLQRDGVPLEDLADYLHPPCVVLSHDCDLLRGNDLWTQAIRLFRVISPLARVRRPRPANLWWAIRNAVRPHDYYLNNVEGFITVERMFGFRSSFYFLNGSGGRYGARSGLKPVSRAVKLIPGEWDIGLHYNYDTHLCGSRLERQKAELRRLTGRTLRSGRAHYLRFDPVDSPASYVAIGVEADESAGYPDRIGYRCGIGGGFQPWDAKAGRQHKLVEIPMVVMDSTLVNQYGRRGPEAFGRLLCHLSKVGGAVTLVFHTGYLFNPEFPAYRHLYHRLLQEARAVGARSLTAARFAADFSRTLPDG